MRSACDAIAASQIAWVAATSCGLAHGYAPCIFSPLASSSTNAAHICKTASEKPNSKIAPVTAG